MSSLCAIIVATLIINKELRKSVFADIIQVKNNIKTIISGVQVQKQIIKDSAINLARGAGVLYLFSSAGIFLFGAFVLSLIKMTQGLILEASTGFLFMLFVSLYFASLGYQAFKNEAPSKLSVTIGGLALFYGLSALIIKNDLI